MKTFRYQKYIDQAVTRPLLLPLDSDGASIGTELATLSDGYTYVSVPNGTTLPKQPKEIAASVKVVTLTPVQVAKIRSASPHIRLIKDRVKTRIRDKYTLDDELKIIHIAIGALQNTRTPSASELREIADFQTNSEAARTWGRAEKQKLGL